MSPFGDFLQRVMTRWRRGKDRMLLSIEVGQILKEIVHPFQKSLFWWRWKWGYDVIFHDSADPVPHKFHISPSFPTI